MSQLITHDTVRWSIAAGAVAVFAVICLWAVLHRRKVPVLTVEDGESIDTLVVYASQTGQAESLARQAAANLAAGGLSAQVVSLRQVTPDLLQRTTRILCVAATAGEGEAPDDAIAFEKSVMATRIDLRHLAFAVLALGDRTHGHFCAFGHRLDNWLAACDATPLRSCIEVDDLDRAAVGDWNGFLQGLGAGSGLVAEEPAFVSWQLAARQVLNPDSRAQKLVQIDLRPTAGGPQWQAGDLIEITTPKGHRRDYSIASLPSEGHIRLFVRQTKNGDGSTLLTEGLPVGGTLDLRVKTHDNFHTPAGEGPLLLIGAGSGLAGLRAHLLAARAAGRKCWMIYGERNPVTDGALCDELLAWQEEGSLSRLDLAFSAVNDGQGRYVQDLLVGRSNELKAWLADAGGVLVCGGLDMGKAIDTSLRAHLGNDWADAAIASGRYRRDLY